MVRKVIWSQVVGKMLAQIATLRERFDWVDLLTYAGPERAWLQECAVLAQGGSLPTTQLVDSGYLHPNSGFACCALQPSGPVVAFVFGFVCCDVLDIHHLYVAPTHRRLGLGRSLLQFARHTAARRQVVTWQLEVRCSNRAAIALYHSCDLVQVGARSAYYSHPTEDAWLFSGELANGSLAT